MVTIDRPAADASTVLLDTREAMVRAVGQLASLGHKALVSVRGPLSPDRIIGIGGLSERGSQTRLVCEIGPCVPNTSSGAGAAGAALSAGTTALIAFNDLIAIGMLQP